MSYENPTPSVTPYWSGLALIILVMIAAGVLSYFLA